DEHISFVLMPVAKGSDGALTAARRGTLTGIFHREKDIQGTQIQSARTTPPAATGGTLAGRQISQPPTSGTVQKPPTMPSQGTIAAQTRDTDASANLSFPSVSQPMVPGTPNVTASQGSSSQPPAG